MAHLEECVVREEDAEGEQGQGAHAHLVRVRVGIRLRARATHYLLPAATYLLLTTAMNHTVTAAARQRRVARVSGAK